MSDVEDAVLEALRKVHGEGAGTIAPDAKLTEFLIDSLDMLEFKMRLEENLNIDLEAEVFKGSTTVREISHRIAAVIQR